MAERDSWAVGSDSDRRVDVEDARFGMGFALTPHTSAINARTGFRPGPTNPGAVTASGTPDGNVQVAAFQLALRGTRGALTPYICTLDSAKTIDILSTPADPSNTRHDLIIAQQSDAFHGDASSLFEVKRVLGTAAGSPVDPTPSGSPDYVVLARVRVTAGASSITNAMIDDLRPVPLRTVALGGVLPVETATARNVLTAYEGMTVYRMDQDWIEVYDGAAWRVRGTAVVSSVASLSTAISNPFAGQLAYVTDVSSIYAYSGSAWASDQMKPRAALRRTTAQSIAAATSVAIQFTTEDEDTHNGHSTGTNPSRYTCQAGWAGRYKLYGGVGLASIATGTRRWASWYKNGAVIPGSRNNVNNTSGGATLWSPRTVTTTLAVGDYVELMVFQEDTGSNAVNTATGADDQPVAFIEYMSP
jgi:hypothetical protein